MHEALMSAVTARFPWRSLSERDCARAHTHTHTHTVGRRSELQLEAAVAREGLATAGCSRRAPGQQPGRPQTRRRLETRAKGADGAVW